MNLPRRFTSVARPDLQLRHPVAREGAVVLSARSISGTGWRRPHLIWEGRDGR